MPTNFELERLKPKLDIFKKPENRVHELTDSNVSRFNRLSWKLVDMFFGIVPMFAVKDFARRRFLAQICANSGAHAHFGAYLRDEAISNKILDYDYEH